MRAVDEWIGANDDSRIPPHVRIRVFDRYSGICNISGRKIRPGDQWDLDHIVAICNGGQNRESNLRLVLRDKHRQKTAVDVSEKAKIGRKRSKHLGAAKSRSPLPGSRSSKWRKRMDGTVEPR